MTLRGIRDALTQVLEALRRDESLLKKARRRYRANRRRAYKAHNQAERAEDRADRMRREGHPLAAARADRHAGRRHAVAYKNHVRAQYWLGRIKATTRRIDKLETREDHLRAEIKRLKGVTIKGNVATGGTPGERWKAVCIASVVNCSSGKRRNAYSMLGSWDVDHPIVPGEQPGQRSDCSQTLTAWAKAAGLPDPNGLDFTGGYTGTQVQGRNGWKQVSETAMRKKGWGYVVYGGGAGHHVEAYIGPGDRTAGHGSPPVDFGRVNLFGNGDYRCFIYDPD
jgi:hypothetical protein